MYQYVSGTSNGIARADTDSKRVFILVNTFLKKRKNDSLFPQRKGRAKTINPFCGRLIITIPSIKAAEAKYTGLPRLQASSTE